MYGRKRAWVVGYCMKGRSCKAPLLERISVLLESNSLYCRDSRKTSLGCVLEVRVLDLLEQETS